MDNDLNLAPMVDPEHSHEYFAELCALASTGTLSAAQWHQLEAHLSHCANCKAIKTEYDKVVFTMLPAMAANRTDADDGDSPEPWSLEDAEAALFERINREKIEPEKAVDCPGASPRSRRAFIGMAAAILLVSCSYEMYRVGMDRGRTSLDIVHTVEKTVPGTQVQVSKAAPAFHRQSEQPDPELTTRLKDLQNSLQENAKKTTALEEQHKSLLAQLAQRDMELKTEEEERTVLEQHLSFSQAGAQALQAKLDSATVDLSSKQSLKVLEQHVEDLEDQLKQKDQQITQDKELLEHDRDIRNLMGARDLYIGEIYDVAKSGKTQRPFGRVFYTQGKSLVFYAYDLDQQPGVKLASTFQVWGRHGIDREHDVSLGIFYQDDQNKKRWVLKSNDSAMLSQLDAVFVTVEPHGASTKPTGKPLLFTYLKLPPNHP